jgi:hypothetical protein
VALLLLALLPALRLLSLLLSLLGCLLLRGLLLAAEQGRRHRLLAGPGAALLPLLLAGKLLGELAVPLTALVVLGHRQGKLLGLVTCLGR